MRQAQNKLKDQRSQLAEPAPLVQDQSKEVSGPDSNESIQMARGTLPKSTVNMDELLDMARQLNNAEKQNAVLTNTVESLKSQLNEAQLTIAQLREDVKLEYERALAKAIINHVQEFISKQSLESSYVTMYTIRFLLRQNF